MKFEHTCLDFRKIIFAIKNENIQDGNEKEMRELFIFT